MTTNEEVARVLRAHADPTARGKHLSVKDVVRVYQPDARGLCEVLYLTGEGQPMTAYVRGREVAYIVDGW